MKLRSITYRSFSDGLVGIDLETGGQDAPLSFSPEKLHRFILDTRRIHLIHTLRIRHAVHVLEEEDELEELVHAAFGMGLPVVSESDGNHLLNWMPGVPCIAHISSEPWYQHACSQIVYHMDPQLAPQIDNLHLQRGTLLLLHIGSKTDVPDAVAFMRKDKRPWRLEIPTRFQVSTDLGTLLEENAMLEEVR